jgi:hypothetical protein
VNEAQNDPRLYHKVDQTTGKEAKVADLKPGMIVTITWAIAATTK